MPYAVAPTPSRFLHVSSPTNPTLFLLLAQLHTLLPAPAEMTFSPGRLPIDSAFQIRFDGFVDGRLRRAGERFTARLSRVTGIRGFVAGGRGRELIVTVGGEEPETLAVGADESYRLEVDGTAARLTSPRPLGALRGLETILQLAGRDDSGAFLPGVSIGDRPRFSWRGLLIDVSRHFEPVDVIKRQLDGMAAVKLDVLHWHLSDDQGVRVESKLFPKLQKMASGGQFYTQAQIREVVRYARDRGIRVVPEFDMPGHATAWFAAYPELASAPGPYRVEPNFGVFRPAFDPTRDAVYDFIDRFVGEMATLFPDSYWHVGGDEVVSRQWRRNPRIQRFMKDNALDGAAALQTYFNRRLAAILAKHDRRMIGWDEILRPDLPPDAMIQSWRSTRGLVDGSKAGHPVILSAGWYLDHMGTAEDYYRVDPLGAAGLDSVSAGLVLGGEACMWGEQLSSVTIDSRIWPRTGAVAERLWSPRSRTDIDDMYRRLAAVSRRLSDWGLGHETHADRMVAQFGPRHGGRLIRRLLDLVQPVGFGERIHRQRPTQLTPFNRMIDAAGPDRPIRRELGRLIDGLLADAPSYQANRDSLLGLFHGWSALADSVDRLDPTQPMVADARLAAGVLTRLSGAALVAIERLGQGASADQASVDSVEPIMRDAIKPAGLLRLELGASVRRLLLAAYLTPSGPIKTR